MVVNHGLNIEQSIVQDAYQANGAAERPDNFISMIHDTSKLRNQLMNDNMSWSYSLPLTPSALEVLEDTSFTSLKLRENDHVFDNLHFNETQFSEFCRRLISEFGIVDQNSILVNEASEGVIIDSDIVRGRFSITNSETERSYHGYVFWDCSTSANVVHLNQVFYKLPDDKEYNGVYPIEIDFVTKHPEKAVQTFVSNPFSKWSSDFNHIVADLYPRINIRQMINSFLSSDESILILTGSAGTGKTSLIKLILREFASLKDDAISTSYVKDEELLELDDLWTYWSKQEPDVLILDDLDHILHSRSNQGGNTFVNRLLSFSDGVFETSTKVIITTNEEVHDVDEALIRPGRCFDMLQMPKLSRDEAALIWNNVFELSDDQFNQAFGDINELRQSTLVSEAERVRDANPKGYLSDQSISIRHHYLD